MVEIMEIHLGGGADGHFPQNYSSCRTKDKYVTKDKNTSFMGREGDVLPSSDMFLPSINMLEWNFIMGKSCSKGGNVGCSSLFFKNNKTENQRLRMVFCPFGNKSWKQMTHGGLVSRRQPT